MPRTAFLLVKQLPVAIEHTAQDVNSEPGIEQEHAERRDNHQDIRKILDPRPDVQLIQSPDEEVQQPVADEEFIDRYFIGFACETDADNPFAERLAVREIRQYDKIQHDARRIRERYVQYSENGKYRTHHEPIEQERQTAPGVSDAFDRQVHFVIERFDLRQQGRKPFRRHISDHTPRGIHHNVVNIEKSVRIIVDAVQAGDLRNFEKQRQPHGEQQALDPACTEIIPQKNTERHRQQHVKKHLKKRPFLQQMQIGARLVRHYGRFLENILQEVERNPLGIRLHRRRRVVNARRKRQNDQIQGIHHVQKKQVKQQSPVKVYIPVFAVLNDQKRKRKQDRRNRKRQKGVRNRKQIETEHGNTCCKRFDKI